MKKVAQRVKEIKQTTDPAALVAALNDPSSLVVEAAAKRIEQPRAASALLRTYLRLHESGSTGDPGCWARIAIIEALARMGAPEGEEAARLAIRTVQVEAVGFGLSDTATGLRVAAAGVMANLSVPGALIDLGILLFDREPNVRCAASEVPYAKLATRVAAAKAIGALGEPGGAALLAVKLAHRDGELAEVLAECMDGLVALREPQTVELLTPWLTNADPYLAAVAATGIAKEGRERAVPILMDHVERVTAEAREALVLAIGSIRAEEAREALRSLTDADDPVVRRTAEGLI